MIEFKYRPDVDGLRAVAVILVLLFHAGLGVPGGYIGVDVFFVISGYLISGLILKGQQNECFSLKGFWVRRIRRIVPAASVMVLAVLVLGYFLLFPNDYVELGKAAIAQQFMLANVWFWQTTGYFKGPADLKPLLHMWSLAVEEQFYLGYPPLLMLLHRYGRRAQGTVLSVLAICSFAASVYGVHHHPSATFFFLPTRAWELLMGGLIWFLPKPSNSHPWLLTAVSWISLITIFASASVLKDTSPFPGVNALYPCVATGALIYANSLHLTIPGELLASRPMVFIGLISYSLYLWHWPILAFARYWWSGLSQLSSMALLACSFGIAILSQRYVETPVRRGDWIWNTGLVTWASLGAVGIACLLFSVVVVSNDGLPSRVPSEALRYHSAARMRSAIINVSPADAADGVFPSFGDNEASRRCLIWGDSHAMHLVTGLDAACQSLHVRGIQATYASTAPLLDFVSDSKWGLNEKSPPFARAVLDYVRQNDVDIVVLAGRWSSYSPNPSFESQVEVTLQELSATGAKVVIILDVANQDVHVPMYLARRAFWNEPVDYTGVSVEQHKSRNDQCTQIINRASRSKASVIDPASRFVDSSGHWPVIIADQVIYADEHHLTDEGSLRMAPVFKRILESHEFDPPLRFGL